MADPSLDTVPADLLALLEEFPAHVKSTHSEATATRYLYPVRKWLTWSQGQPATPELLRQYGRHLKTTAFRPRTRNVDKWALNAWFKFLKERRKLRKLPDLAAMDTGRLDQPAVRWATEEELRLLWKTARALPQHTLRDRFRRGRALVVLAILSYGGLRRSEMLGVDLSDVLLDEDPPRIVVRFGKGAETRWVPVKAELDQVIREWLPIRAEWCQLHLHPSGALLPVDRVRRLSHLGLTTTLRQLCKAAGTRNLTPHCFRRWCGTETERAGGAAAAQALLGHSHISTTYGYLGTNSLRVSESVEAIPSLDPSAPHPAHMPAAATNEHLWRQLL